MTPAETARAVNLLVLDTLKAGGWTLTRDNEDGGALVLEGDGVRIVGGFHAYDIKALKAKDEAIAAAVKVESLPTCEKHDKRMVLSGDTPICLTCEAEDTEAVAEAEESDAMTVVVHCGRCDSPWGTDETCEDCTYENGEPKPLPAIIPTNDTTEAQEAHDA